MKNSLDVDAELIRGSGGEFEVTVEGKLVFSKQKTGRFPDEGEVEKLIKP